MSAAAFMQLSAYAPFVITVSGQFAAAVRHVLDRPSNESTRLAKFLWHEGS
jgi:hypothetical protein